MNKIIILLITISISLFANNFSKSKKILLKQIYHDNKISFYCSNPYEITRVKNKEVTLIVQDDKYYTPRNVFTKKGNENVRAKRIEWEHIMPAENFGRHLPCWKEGGRKVCNKDKLFNQMEADMHNLVPAIGEVNADRSNFRFGADLPKKGMYGNCEFEVNFKDRRAYPKKEIRGDIARIYLYMSDKYNINLSNQERKLMEAWNKQDPVDEWERIKNKRVEKLQGNLNPYVK
ncbi:deoxyribonuclease [Aliarcobacter skirrowii]|uniref:endonuclease n=1 Tax=Aliarcobacter skirrowii TaxID=28200 RepID=UPI000F676F64|nr:endonuclease [Aliarcobacter skirrowii]AZL53717.1 deoxyribonuclease [Aliarcobacter skirrowii]